MDNLKKYSLLDEVYSHCIASLRGFILVEDQLTSPKEIQNKIIWINLQTALVHGVIVANYILSPKKKAKNRTNYLQKILRPTKESPLYTRNARNYLIHIDEKFDHWINDNDNYNGMLESVLKDRKSFNYLQDSKKFVRRVLLLKERIFIYQVNTEIREIELNPVLEELDEIRKKIEKNLNDLENGSNDFYLFRP